MFEKFGVGFGEDESLRIFKSLSVPAYFNSLETRQQEKCKAGQALGKNPRQ